MLFSKNYICERYKMKKLFLFGLGFILASCAEKSENSQTTPENPSSVQTGDKQKINYQQLISPEGNFGDWKKDAKGDRLPLMTPKTSHEERFDRWKNPHIGDERKSYEENQALLKRRKQKRK